MKHLPKFFLLVDLGFIAYWLVTALELIPPQYLYNEYHNPLLVAWNWSFFALDMLVSATGLYALYLSKANDGRWHVYALLSLAFTHASGLMAISFWTIQGDYSIDWWIPNLFLMLYPLFFVPALIKKINIIQ